VTRGLGASQDDRIRWSSRRSARLHPSTLDRLRRLALAAIIAFACLTAYWNALSGPFVYDDELTIIDNRSIREWWRLPDVLQAEQDSPTAGRPVVNVSFALNYAFAGLAVRPYHAINLLVHVLCALVVFALLRTTLALPSIPERLRRRSTRLAFAIALIWSVHPLNSEVVDYITQRTESLMALFYLLTIYAGVHAVGSRYPLSWQTVAVACCGLGMAAKESMATAPLILILYDRTFLFGSFKTALQQRWRFYCAIGSTWLLLAALLWSIPRGESAGFASGVDPWTYLLNQTVMITQYLRQALWPRYLVASYGWPLSLTLPDVLPQALLLTLLFGLATAAVIRSPKLGFAGAWFFITLAPTSSVVPIATEVGAERRMYLPLVALIALVILGGSSLWDALKSRWLERRGRPGVLRHGDLIGLFGVVALLMAGTIARNREYSSFVTLARTVVDRWPTSVAHHVLGGALLAEGAYDEAIVRLREALAGSPRAYYDLGAALFNQGKLDEAIGPLRTMIRIWESPPATHPYWLAPVRGDVVSARLLIGRALAQQERFAEAAVEFEQVLAMAPSHVETRKLLAMALFRDGSYERAIPHFEEYLRSWQADVEPLRSLAIAYVATGKVSEAVAMFRRAVDAEPANGLTRRHLANALYDTGRFEEAVVHASEAVRLRPNDADARDLLGRVHGVQGRFNEAATEFERALEIDPAHPDARKHLERVRAYGRR
jgi:tetratricopeptide (TPR) repeat protein